MPIAASMLPELDREMVITRSLLERVPADRAHWAPHAKSFALGELAVHIADLPNWVTMTLDRSELDMLPADGSTPTRPELRSTAALLEQFDGSLSVARAALERATDEELSQTWTLKRAGEVILAMPRMGVLRTWVLNHVIHHRGQLSVYLRLLDVPPAIHLWTERGCAVVNGCAAGPPRRGAHPEGCMSRPSRSRRCPRNSTTSRRASSRSARAPSRA